MKSVAIAAFAIGLLSVAAPASAHHSYATFDRDKAQTVSGVVHEFRWVNPHAWIDLDVRNEKGVVERWSIECNSPNILSRVGWKSNMLRPGDKVTLQVHPLRNGDAGGSLMSLKLPDGTVLSEAGKTL